MASTVGSRLRFLVLASLFAGFLNFCLAQEHQRRYVVIADEDAESFRRNLLAGKATCSSLHPACSRCRLVRADVDVTNNTSSDTENVLGGLAKPVSNDTASTNSQETTKTPLGQAKKQVKTILVCTACENGWVLRRTDPYPSKCDCAAGLADDGNGGCGSCPKGKFCTGQDKGGGTAAPQDCPFGLTTIIQGAKSKLQCMTMSGYGRVTKKDPVTGHIVIESVICPHGTYNSGSNTAGCQKCPPDMTTRIKGSGKKEDCTAPAGYFVSNGVAKKCQKGTFAADFNDQPFCTKCGKGLTTPSEGSASAGSCSYAVRGMYISAATGEALPCPLDTYSDLESNDTSCKPCPFGLKTEFEGTEGIGLCLAPPGYELLPDAVAPTKCKKGFYKEGWNKNLCVPCGLNIDTEAEGSTSVDDCFIPPGYGTVMNDNTFNVSAELCVRNSHGYPVKMPNIKTAFCQYCAPNTYTMDVLTGVNATQGYTVPEDCKVMPGWGIDKSLVAVPCKIGTWNDGFNRKECQDCPAVHTTLWDKANSSNHCVLKPGWAYDLKLNLPKPCELGTYSEGGTLANPRVQCTPCVPGYSTQTDSSVGLHECNVCSAGHGGGGCGVCDYDTFSTGGHHEELDCRACAAGTTSARGAEDDTQCYPTMLDADNDYFVLSDDSKWTDDATATTSVECQNACDNNAACIMYRFGSAKCQVLLEEPNGGRVVGVRANKAAMDYSLYRVPTDLHIGQLISDAGNITPDECLGACTASNECELFTIELEYAITLGNAGVPTLPGPCKLMKSVIDADWTGMAHVQGNRLFSDMYIRERVGGPTVVGEV